MNDKEIEQACEALRRVLKAHSGCQFGLIRGEIAHGRIKELKLHPEAAGILNGQMVAPDPKR